jgi:hypothetical protein
MSDRKIVHDLSVEELIQLASGAKPSDIKVKEATEAAKFIYALNIRHGDVRIPAQLIYYTYKQWKGWDHKYQPKPFFFRDFTTYFEQVRTKEGISYLLDPKPFDLSQETYWLLRKDIREQKAKKRKKASGSGT